MFKNKASWQVSGVGHFVEFLAMPKRDSKANRHLLSSLAHASPLQALLHFFFLNISSIIESHLI